MVNWTFLLWALWIVCLSTASAMKKCDKRMDVLMSDCDGACDVACIIHQKENRRLTDFGAGGLRDTVGVVDASTMQPEAENRIWSPAITSERAHPVESDTESGCQYLCKNPFQRDDWAKNRIHYKLFSIRDDYQNNTNLAAVVSAKNLDKIDLKLPKDLKRWELDGGHLKPIRNVEISYGMFKGATNLTALAIQSIDVSIDKLLQNLPKGITALSLINCNISEVPAILSKFEALTRLDLSWNQISSFEANLSSLYYLNLANNSFKSIPSSVVNLTSLSALDVYANPLDDRNVSDAVYQVLDRTIGGSNGYEDARGKCSNGTFKTVGNTNLSVCVAEEDKASQSSA